MIKLKTLLKSEHRNIVSLYESPMRLTRSFNPDELGSLGKNNSFTIATREKAKNIGKFKNCDLYEYFSGDYIINILISNDYTVAFFQYKIINNIVEEHRIWQDATCIGLCREFMFEYFLKKYGGLLSDDSHTELGQKYWEKLLTKSLEVGYKIFVVVKNHQKIPLENPADIKQFYFDSPRGLEYKFLILKYL